MFASHASSKDRACLCCELSPPSEEARSFSFCLPSVRSIQRKYADFPKTAHSLRTSTLPPHMLTTEATELFLTAITTPPGVHLSLPVHWHKARQPRRLCSLSWPTVSMVVGPAHHVAHIRFRQSSRSPAFSVCVTKTFSVHHVEPRARHILTTCIWLVSLVFSCMYPPIHPLVDHPPPEFSGTSLKSSFWASRLVGCDQV